MEVRNWDGTIRRNAVRSPRGLSSNDVPGFVTQAKGVLRQWCADLNRGRGQHRGVVDDAVLEGREENLPGP